MTRVVVLAAMAGIAVGACGGGGAGISGGGNEASLVGTWLGESERLSLLADGRLVATDKAGLVREEGSWAVERGELVRRMEGASPRELRTTVHQSSDRLYLNALVRQGGGRGVPGSFRAVIGRSGSARAGDDYVDTLTVSFAADGSFARSLVGRYPSVEVGTWQRVADDTVIVAYEGWQGTTVRESYQLVDGTLLVKDSAPMRRHRTAHGMVSVALEALPSCHQVPLGVRTALGATSAPPCREEIRLFLPAGEQSIDVWAVQASGAGCVRATVRVVVAEDVEQNLAAAFDSECSF